MTNLEQLIDDMKAILELPENKELGGVAIASPQVSREDVNVVVVQRWAYINPRITALSTETNIQQEGCLSFPRVFRSISRSNEIVVEFEAPYKGSLMKGSKKMSGIEARIMQHEIDHLEGKTILDV